MSTIHPDDPLLDAIAALPAVGPDTGHADRVRDRCHAALHHSVQRPPVAWEPAAVGTFCALYAWHVVRIAIQIPLP